MRYIDPADITSAVSSEWLLRARKATDGLIACPDSKARNKLMRADGALWAELKSVLASLSSNKCWYCESRNERSDNAVDHYRPKGRVSTSKGHDGYWWLAFDYTNYRFSCTYCNSRRRGDGGTIGGKQDEFPLASEATRVITPGDLSGEIPLLLDPCSYSDVMLLWFDETGQVTVDPQTALLDGHAEEKVDASIMAYHLDHVRLTGARRRIYLKIKNLCDRADALYGRIKDDEGCRAQFKGILQDIAGMLQSASDFSATARCAIRGYRANSRTAELVVDKYY